MQTDCADAGKLVRGNDPPLQRSVIRSGGQIEPCQLPWSLSSDAEPDLLVRQARILFGLPDQLLPRFRGRRIAQR